MIRQSLCVPLYQQEGFGRGELFTELKGIGFQAVELWKRPPDLETIVRDAAAAGLRVASMSGHDSLTSGLNDPTQHDRIETELRESIAVAAHLSIPGLICFSGNRLADQDEETGLANTVAGLRRIAGEAEKRGVNLNLELLNSKIDHPGYQCDSSAWGFEVCRRIDSPRVKVLYDIYHMQIMEGDIIRTIRENIRWIGHFHTAGNPGRRDLDDHQELNYRGICEAIAESGYDLYVGHEYSPKGAPLPSLRAAYEVCDC
jgi:hydroxypyruvate isomerase